MSRKIDRDRVRALVLAGAKNDRIAELLGCSVKAISYVRKEIGLPFGAPLPPGPRPAPQPDEVVRDPLLATKGRYSALASYAAQDGITLTVAQQRWHRARMEAAQ